MKLYGYFDICTAADGSYGVAKTIISVFVLLIIEINPMH